MVIRKLTYALLTLSGLALSGLALSGCDTASKAPTEQTTERSFTLPVPHSNNAVAVSPNGNILYSFNGLTAGKTHKDISRSVFACTIAANTCKALDDLPVSQGRLATIAVTLGDYIYVMGGYSVAEDDSEKSQPEVMRFDPKTHDYKRMADMPTPVDDSIALTYQDRYIYLISGWHDDGNVNLVQLYDSKTNIWSRATDYPGAPVFGHAGGIVDTKILIADGVKQLAERLPNGSRYAASNQAWRGDINPNDPRIIHWRKAAPHDGKPLYRMASAGNKKLGQIIFAGGSDNPYNYDGIGYDKIASKPSAAIFGYDFNTESWQSYAPMKKPTMDHRGLLFTNDRAYIIGGMDTQQNVIADITEFTLTKDEPL